MKGRRSGRVDDTWNIQCIQCGAVIILTIDNPWLTREGDVCGGGGGGGGGVGVGVGVGGILKSDYSLPLLSQYRM